MIAMIACLLVGFVIGRLRYHYYVKEVDRIAGPYSYRSAIGYCDYLNKSGKPAKVVRIWRL